ncbi:MAG: hypothetical protein ACO1SX_06565 [Actinomycetota bacterium]
MSRWVLALAAILVSVSNVEAGEVVSRDAVSAAVRKAIPLLEKGSLESTAKVRCFTCHNQAVPVFALALAAQRGFQVDAANLKKQAEFTLADLRSAREAYLQGKGQGGGATRAGYALFTLQAAGAKGDEVTAAVTEFLLLRDKEGWRTASNRPPSEGSSFSSTALALRGLREYGAPAQQERIKARTLAARDWLLKSAPKDTEDQVFRLWALKEADADAAAVLAAARTLKDGQREDGGWPQLPGGESDAYATGSALVALHLAGGVAAQDGVYQRGLSFLMRTQLPDGTWLVKSRSKPFQPYFESGFPHGTDQFISIAASGWAAAALALAVPVPGR